MYSKLNFHTLLEEEMTRQSCSYRAMQLLLGENKSSHHLAWTGSELPQAPFAICPVDRSYQLLPTSQSSGETTLEFLLVMDSL
jgi:hypothetical protein